MSHKLAITIAGAVSLGSFEAGVLFEVLDSLGQHNRAAASDDRIYIDVLTGASAGGMTAAIAAQNLLYGSSPVTDPYDNPFYNAWVARVDINGLLPLGPKESANQSVLSSDFVNRLAKEFLLGRYNDSPVPPPAPHPALDPEGEIRLGLALSNLNGVDYQRKLLSGGTFNYTRFQDEITFVVGAGTDNAAAWIPITSAAVACGAFPLAFRPTGVRRDVKEFDSPFLAPWPQSPRDFTYTDGGVFQNQPIGLAKNLVDLIDHHQASDRRSYLFVSPHPVDPTVGGITADSATFKPLAGSLVNAVYNQAGFRDWIEAESVNDAVNVLNLRASQLAALLKNATISPTSIQSVTAPLLLQFQPNSAELQSARNQLRTQFADDYAKLASSTSRVTADAWVDALLLLELAANLHERDEMYIYSIAADRKDLAGAGFSSFLGFLYRSFREHDYDLGRQKAQAFLTSINQISQGKLPRLTYIPNPIRPIQATPANGFTPTMIPEQNRKQLCDALSKAVDNILTQLGVSWVVRKGLETFYVNGKIKKMLQC